jgi:hypothetical protein
LKTLYTRAHPRGQAHLVHKSLIWHEPDYTL